MNTSSRLILKKPQEIDFERFYEINADPDTNLFNPNGPMDLEAAQKYFNNLLNQWNKNGFGFWSISEIENPNYIIGFGGLDYRLYGNSKKLNVGYRFDKKYWGKGYATEIAKTAIDFGLQDLKKNEIFAIVRPNHVASINVLEKCNMEFYAEINDVPYQANSLIYIIKSECS